MVRRMIVTLSVLAVMGVAVPAMADGCKGCAKIAKGSDGFCCGKGRAFGVKLASQKLYDALKGEEMSPEQKKNCRCSGCKTALQTNGRCDHCKLVSGKTYGSPVAYTLAKGAPISAELIKACPKRCKQCKSAFSKDGRCPSCDVGFVAGRMFEKIDLYEAAVVAFNTLKKAVTMATSCETCAVAMVTDGECAKCKIEYKDGKIASDKG